MNKNAEFNSETGPQPANPNHPAPCAHPPAPAPIASEPPSPPDVPDPIDDAPPLHPDSAAPDPSAIPNTHRKARRNGRVACLPKLQRDMVSRMIWNGVPYKNIVDALDDTGFTLSERNISNWATRGGYHEWRLEQEQVLQNRLEQDHLLDFLRRDDASELPEVGLQAAATRLSQILVRKTLQDDSPEPDLENLAKLVDLLGRVNRVLAPLQKERDDSRRSLGEHFDPARVKEHDQLSVIETERFYSDPPDDAEMPKPAVPPLMPLVPTGSALKEEAEQARRAAELRHQEELQRMMRSFSGNRPVTGR